MFRTSEFESIRVPVAVFAGLTVRGVLWVRVVVRVPVPVVDFRVRVPAARAEAAVRDRAEFRVVRELPVAAVFRELAVRRAGVDFLAGTPSAVAAESAGVLFAGAALFAAAVFGAGSADVASAASPLDSLRRVAGRGVRRRTGVRLVAVSESAVEFASAAEFADSASRNGSTDSAGVAAVFAVVRRVRVVAVLAVLLVPPRFVARLVVPVDRVEVAAGTDLAADFRVLPPDVLAAAVVARAADVLFRVPSPVPRLPVLRVARRPSVERVGCGTSRSSLLLSVLTVSHSP